MNHFSLTETSQWTGVQKSLLHNIPYFDEWGIQHLLLEKQDYFKNGTKHTKELLEKPSSVKL